jgi:hypothetical protein
MRNLAAALVLVVATLAQAQEIRIGSRVLRIPEGKKFSVVIERSGTQWKAKCELGCAWTGATLSFSCPENCDAILDANGLITTLARRDAPAAFSFVLSEDRNGKIIAKRNVGTEWGEISWTCEGKDPCTARVNEFGVLLPVSFGK